MTSLPRDARIIAEAKRAESVAAIALEPHISSLPPMPRRWVTRAAAALILLGDERRGDRLNVLTRLIFPSSFALTWIAQLVAAYRDRESLGHDPTPIEQIISSTGRELTPAQIVVLRDRERTEKAAAGELANWLFHATHFDETNVAKALRDNGHIRDQDLLVQLAHALQRTRKALKLEYREERSEARVQSLYRGGVLATVLAVRFVHEKFDKQRIEELHDALFSQDERLAAGYYEWRNYGESCSASLCHIFPEMLSVDPDKFSALATDGAEAVTDEQAKQALRASYIKLLELGGVELSRPRLRKAILKVPEDPPEKPRP